MTGIGHTLNIARSALSAQQYGLSVAGHNIANVNTPSYSRQMLGMTTNQPILYGGLVFGAGVSGEEVRRVANDMLETRLMDQYSDLAKFEGAETYVQMLESLFNENSESSISNLMSDFWNAWQDLSNNPGGFTERGIVFEQGRLIGERLNAMNDDLTTMEEELTREIESLVTEVNSITREIASVNQEVVRLQINGSANDQRDKRNALLTELAEKLDIYTFEQPDGAVNVTTAKGFSLVNGTDAYGLNVSLGQINWQGSYDTDFSITGNITGGRIGGLLDVRDEIVAKYRTELDMLTESFIWATNLQHSQGSGLDYFDTRIDGTYKTDASGWLDTLSFGDRIDYTEDFKMWIQDNSTSTPVYHTSTIDMGISDAVVTSWNGTAPEGEALKYVFTVTDGGSVDMDGNVAMMDGPQLGIVRTATDAAAALNAAIADQTITVFGAGSGTQSIQVADGGDAERSAASIAAALNGLDGVTATAFENAAVLDFTDLMPLSPTGADENDLITFDLTSGNRTETVSFRAGAFDYETRANMQTALNDAVARINDFGNDLAVSYAGDTAVLRSASGENIGVADFDVQDLSVTTLSNFQNFDVNTVVDVSNFQNFGVGDTVDFALSTAQGTVNVNYTFTGAGADVDLANALAASGAAGIGVGWVAAAGTVTMTGNAAAGYVDFEALTAGPGGDESFDITPQAGTSANPAAGDNTLLFDGTGDVEQYAGDNTVTFDVNGTGVSVDLSRLDTTDQAAVAARFYTELDTNIPDAYVSLDGTSVTITATDEVASNIVIDNGADPNGGDGSFDVAVPGGTQTSPGATFVMDGATTVSFDSVVEDAVFVFDGTQLTESGSGLDDSALKTGTATILLAPNVTIQSNVNGAAGGVFNQLANAPAITGSNVLTLGGDGGYDGFDANNRITFNVDGTAVSYIIGAGDVTDADYAAGIAAAMTAVLDPAVYTVSRHGSYVSALKNDGTVIELTQFADDDFGGGTPATLSVSPNQLLIANNLANNSAVSRTFGDQGVIEWEKFTDTGQRTGERGTIRISDAGPFDVDLNGLSFTIGPGDLVAGNTFELNTDSTGAAAPLDMRATRTANSVLDTYVFRVDADSGGEIGSDDITITWTNSVTYGSFTLPGRTPPEIPDALEVDGMRLKFETGTLFAGDTFTIKTDENGAPSLTKPSDWHWTMESFADQFNRQTRGVRADVSNERISFSPDAGGRRIDNIRYTGSDGFCEANCTIDVRNYDALTRDWQNVQIERDATAYAATGGWNITGVTNPGYQLELAPIDGFDMDNGFYVELDGVRALAVRFDAPISDDGSVTFDITPDTGEYSFAFGDDAFADSGLAAALGVNTFFTGDDAMTIRMNSVVEKDKGHIAAARINGETGEISSGDNTNALIISGLQHEDINISQWSFASGEDAVANNLNTSLDDYYNLMVGSLGIDALTVSRGVDFSEIMVDQISQLRDSVAAVSLDEEMINIMKFQHAFTVASKLLSVSDEMMNTLVSMR